MGETWYFCKRKWKWYDLGTIFRKNDSPKDKVQYLTVRMPPGKKCLKSGFVVYGTYTKNIWSYRTLCIKVPYYIWIMCKNYNLLLLEKLSTFIIIIVEYVCLFCGLTSHWKFFHSYGAVTIIGEGLQYFTYAWHSWSGPLSSEGFFAWLTYIDTGHAFIMVNHHLGELVTFTPVDERLAVEQSLPVFTT